MNRITTRRLRLVRNSLTIVAGVLLAYRLMRAANQSLADFAAASATTAALIGATVFGALTRIHELRQRAERAEAEVIQMSDAVLSDEEDQALWDSIPAAGTDEDTCAFGINVIALNQYRYPRAG